MVSWSFNGNFVEEYYDNRALSWDKPEWDQEWQMSRPALNLQAFAFICANVQEALRMDVFSVLILH